MNPPEPSPAPAEEWSDQEGSINSGFTMGSVFFLKADADPANFLPFFPVLCGEGGAEAAEEDDVPVGEHSPLSVGLRREPVETRREARGDAPLGRRRLPAKNMD